MQVVDVLRGLFGHLDACEIQYMVGGSFASGAWGEPRHTNDIDIVANLDRERATCLIQSAHPSFQIGEQELEHALSAPSQVASFQMLHTEALFKIDVFVLAQTDFAQSSFARRIPIEVIPGLLANCATAEDMILQKLRWFVQGNRVSDRQWHDVVKILEVQGDRLDGEYLDTWAANLDLVELLGNARSEAWTG